MTVCSSISTCSKNVSRLSRLVYGQMASNACSVRPSTACFQFYCGDSRRVYINTNTSSRSSSVSSCGLSACHGCCFGGCIRKRGRIFRSVSINEVAGATLPHKRTLTVSLASKKMDLKVLLPKQGKPAQVKIKSGPRGLSPGRASAGLIFGLLVCYSTSEPVHAEAANDKSKEELDHDSSYVKFSHGKKVYTDYSITGIPGDGRCLFRSVVHGASRRLGKPTPTESLQRELADELRDRVADEFIKRREETEWFIEGDFDTYVAKMRKPHIWGGEPELLMASHVLKMPITVYMYDKDSGGLIIIAEDGQEYGKENPVRVLYHGFGHYDALQIPSPKGAKSKL